MKLLRENTQYTDVYFDDDVLKSINISKKEIKNILLNLKEGKSIFSYCGQIVSALPCDFPRLLVEWNKSSNTDHAIRNILISSFLSAEEKCSGSAIIAAGLWCSDEIDKEQKYRNSKSTQDSLNKCLDFFGGSGMTKNAADAAIKMGAIGHKVEYLETDYHITKVESVIGKDIIGSVDPLFGNRVGHVFDLESCIICAIDGTVETVSSLHRILEESSDKNIVILANNFLPDVSNSMAETWIQKRGKCIPIKVTNWNIAKFIDYESLGICCVSPDRGDITTNISLKSSKILSINILKDKVTIQLDNGSDRSKIIVSVSKTLGGLTGIAIDRIKTLIGYSRLVARSGVITWEDLEKESKKLSHLYSEKLVIPLSSWVNGQKANSSLQKILQNLGCLIIVKRGETL